MSATDRPRDRWRLAAIAVLAFACAGHAPARAQGDLQRTRVEGAFLVNFIRFTEWPRWRLGGSGQSFVVSVVGSEDVAAAVREVAEAAGPVQGRRIVVRQVDGDGIRRRRDALRNSHLVFVDRSGGVPASEVVRLVDGAGVLTVGDSAGFVQAGGMLALVASGSRVGFVANPQAIRRGGLSVSAKVLKLARDTTP